MKCLKLFALITVALACTLPVAAQNGYWNASSSNARAITGDITIADARITIALLYFPLAQIRALKPEEISAAFDAESGGVGYLYRLNIPAAQRFLHHNTLCGTEVTEWMATYVEHRNLHLAFFTGANPPVFTFEALSNSTDRCGTFSYAR